MDINQLIAGNEYKLIHAYGQPSQIVMVLKVEEKTGSNDCKYLSADIIYTSNDGSKGLRTSMNTIECERYLRPL